MNKTVAVIPTTINRRLAAIAFADVAGFSRLMALNDVETVRRWKALRTEIMQPAELRPEVVSVAKHLRRKRPKGGQLSCREVSAELFGLGHVNKYGKPFSASSIRSMLS